MIRKSFLNRWLNKEEASVSVSTTPTAIFTEAEKTALLERYRQFEISSYATVRDYCDSADWLPQLMLFNGDLKDVQRPWTVKALIGSVAPGGRLVEIGGGEPTVAAALAAFGYQVTVVDPYDGAGNGPTEYERYAKQFPQIAIVKDRFGAHLPFAEASFDGVYSVSVLEHLPEPEIAAVFAATKKFLRAGGCSLHCVDSVIAGNDTDYCYRQSKLLLKEQAKLAAQIVDESEYDQLLEKMANDMETFYLSAQGHHVWRNGQAYNDFPFRKVISLQTSVRNATA